MFDDLWGRLGIGELNSGVCGRVLATTGDDEIQSMNPANGRALPSVHMAIDRRLRSGR